MRPGRQLGLELFVPFSALSDSKDIWPVKIPSTGSLPEKMEKEDPVSLEQSGH